MFKLCEIAKTDNLRDADPAAFEHMMGRSPIRDTIFVPRGIITRCVGGLTDGVKQSALVFAGGRSVYAKVSRAAVYKRMESGSVLRFCFHISGKTKKHLW